MGEDKYSHRQYIIDTKWDHWHDFMGALWQYDYNVVMRKLLSHKSEVRGSYRHYTCACCNELVSVGLWESITTDMIVLCNICNIHYENTLKKRYKIRKRN